MTTKLLTTLTVIATLAVVPVAASAAEPVHAPAPPVAHENGIIAILIGFTPPIGSNKGS